VVTFHTAYGGIALLLWIVMLVVERRRDNEIRAFTWAFVILAAVVMISHHAGSLPGSLTGARVHTGNQFHYYLGSKYFAELGYQDLYAATLAADDDFLAAGGDPADGFAHIRRTRDMGTYGLTDRDEVVAGFDRSLISPDRLVQLGEDSRFFRAHAGTHKSGKILRDMGFNPAPPWLLLGVPVANLIDLGGPLYPLITASDVIMHVLILGALWWAFGLRTAAIAAVWLHAMPINTGRMTGAFLTYDWLAAVVVAWAAWHKDHPKLAGVALSWAAMTRLFPGLMVLPIVARVGWDLLRRRKQDPRRWAFTIAFCAACAVLLIASVGTGRGPQVWSDWGEKIVRHSHSHPTTGAQRVGLGRVVLHDPSPDRFWRAPRKRSVETKAAQHRLKRLVQLVGLLLLLAAVSRSEDSEAMLLMLFAAWLLTVSSRYYASIWVLFFTLPRARAPARVTGTILFFMIAGHHLVPSEVGRYLALNYEAALLFVVLCGLALWPRAGAISPGRPR
jgi:hypothetical protein